MESHASERQRKRGPGPRLKHEAQGLKEQPKALDSCRDSYCTRVLRALSKSSHLYLQLEINQHNDYASKYASHYAPAMHFTMLTFSTPPQSLEASIASEASLPQGQLRGQLELPADVAIGTLVSVIVSVCVEVCECHHFGTMDALSQRVKLTETVAPS